MRRRSSSSGRNASVTVTVTVTDYCDRNDFRYLSDYRQQYVAAWAGRLRFARLRLELGQ